jgi:hypothetical protein
MKNNLGLLNRKESLDAFAASSPLRTLFSKGQQRKWQKKYKPALWKGLPMAQEKELADETAKELKRLGLPVLRVGNRVEIAQSVTTGKSPGVLIKPLRRKTISKATAKTAARRRAYLKALKRWQMLPENTYCRVWLLSDKFRRELAKSGKPSRRPFATQCHHRRGRVLTRHGDLLLLVSEWVPVSAAGHDWIDRNRSEARKLGLLAPHGEYNTWPNSNKV